jgi:large subunit ribosomal protein L18
MKRRNLKRRMLGVTDYKKRLALLKSGTTRLVVRKTSNNIVAQLVDYKPEGDVVVATADVIQLRKLGWNGGANTAAAYLVGYLVGKLARGKKVHKAVLDTGRHPKSTRIFAVVKGALDAGLKVPHSEASIPAEERLRGTHINDYMKTAKGHQFSKYKKKELVVVTEFEQVLGKLKGEGG